MSTPLRRYFTGISIVENLGENYWKWGWRAQYDFDVVVPKISTPRFSTMLVPVKYLPRAKIHRPGHHPLNSFGLSRFSQLLFTWFLDNRKCKWSDFFTESSLSEDLSKYLFDHNLRCFRGIRKLFFRMMPESTKESEGVNQFLVNLITRSMR